MRNGPQPRKVRHIGMRLWLVLGFTLVATFTVLIMLASVTGSSREVFSDLSKDLAFGRTIQLADRLSDPEADIDAEVRAANVEGFAAWFFTSAGEIGTDESVSLPILNRPSFAEVRRTATTGIRASRVLRGNEVILTGVPVFVNGELAGGVVGRYKPPVLVNQKIDDLRSQSVQAALLAVFVGTLLGLGLASLITIRLKRIAARADDIATGNFDVSLPVGGRDEIGDLARSLDTMRSSLKENFGVLTADRDKLTAIFDGLNDAVMVVDYEGPVRFYNSAAMPLLDRGGLPPDAMLPQIKRAEREGFSAHPALRIGDRAYALQARSLPDESAVLVRCARNSPSASSSAMRPTNSETLWPASRGRSRSCSPGPRMTLSPATTSSTGFPQTPTG
jgi:HAMP domain-containing protein